MTSSEISIWRLSLTTSGPVTNLIKTPSRTAGKKVRAAQTATRAEQIERFKEREMLSPLANKSPAVVSVRVVWSGKT
jgi:hypothetical protein